MKRRFRRQAGHFASLNLQAVTLLLFICGGRRGDAGDVEEAGVGLAVFDVVAAVDGAHAAAGAACHVFRIEAPLQGIRQHYAVSAASQQLIQYLIILVQGMNHPGLQSDHNRLAAVIELVLAPFAAKLLVRAAILNIISALQTFD